MISTQAHIVFFCCVVAHIHFTYTCARSCAELSLQGSHDRLTSLWQDQVTQGCRLAAFSVGKLGVDPTSAVSVSPLGLLGLVSTIWLSRGPVWSGRNPRPEWGDQTNAELSCSVAYGFVFLVLVLLCKNQ